ncbi:cation:proton antiporter [candidate division WOR-3 bacterium]|nr:cation:proton antiporter [candidate division WOR-3 bacterium]
MIGTVYLVIIGFGVLLCLFRMIKGPTAPDRAVALDTSVTVTTALLVLIGLILKRQIYLDVSLVYAVLTFIGSVTIARYLEGGIG